MDSRTALAARYKEMKMQVLHLTSCLTCYNVTIVPCLQQSQNCLNRWKRFQRHFKQSISLGLESEKQFKFKKLGFHVTLFFFFEDNIHYLINYHNNLKFLYSSFYLQVSKKKFIFFFSKGKEFAIPILEMQKVAEENLPKIIKMNIIKRT